MRTIHIVVPDSITIKDLSGEVSGHKILMWVDAKDNRLLVDVNMTMLQVTVDGVTDPPPPDPDPPDPPKPVEYAPYHTNRVMNLRTAPTTKSTIARTVPTNANLELSTEIVTPDVLARLGLSNLQIEAGYEWRVVKANPVQFIAAKIGATVTVVAGAYTPPPTSTTGPPAPLDGMKGLTIGKAPNGYFLRGGQALGVDIRECIYFGHPNIVPYLKQADWDIYFKFLSDNGFKWVRCYVFNLNATMDDTINRMRAMLDKADQYHIRIVAVFCDSIGNEIDSGARHKFTFKEHLPYHLGPHLHLVKKFYHDNAWQTVMLPAILRIVREFRTHKALGMWQIMNEGAIYPQPATQADADAFERMVSTISEAIWQLDKSTPISDGCISANHHAPTGIDLRTYARSYFNRMKYLHVATVHIYQDLNSPGNIGAGEYEAMITLEEAQTTGRPGACTELGAKVNRPFWLRGLLDRLLGRKVSFALQWALELPPFRAGIGDNDYGWGNLNFMDFDTLLVLFKEYQARIKL